MLLWIFAFTNFLIDALKYPESGNPCVAQLENDETCGAVPKRKIRSLQLAWALAID